MISQLLRITAFSCITLWAAQAHAGLLDRIVAVVNDNIILLSELDEQVEQARAELRQRQITAPDMATMQARVLDNMIMQRLQEERAQQRGIRVSDDEINAQLLQMAQANNLNLEQLRDVLNRQLPDGFNVIRQQISEQILIQKLREIEIIAQIHVTEEEINNFIRRRQLETTRTEYRLAHILITRPESPTPEQRQALQQKVQDIHQQLRDGADFGQMAVRHSESNRALEGGDLGWLQADQIPLFFMEAIQNLQPGQISAIIDTPSGYHLIKLLDKRSEQQQNEALEQEAIQNIRMRKANETFDTWMRRLRDDAYVDIRLNNASAL